jgi:hypothetical protein
LSAKQIWYFTTPNSLPLVSDKTLLIAFLELYPIDISAIVWGKDWKWKNILFWCDNEATVGIVKKRPI